MDSFDLRNTLIPFSMLQVANHFAKMKIGEEMEIIGDDAEIYQDLQHILPVSEYEWVVKDVENPPVGKFRVILRKTNLSTPKSKGEQSCPKI